jgi:hypothetical protein
VSKKRKLDKCYHDLSNEELMAMFDNIGKLPENRVKRTGHVKLSAAKFGDQILDFVKARRAAEVEDMLNNFNWVGSRHHY